MTTDDLFGPGWLDRELDRTTKELANKPRDCWPRYTSRWVTGNRGEKRYLEGSQTTKEVWDMLESLRTVDN